MKFGKHIQKRQLDIPEYAASFVDYKALKKLIKKLGATPIISAQHISSGQSDPAADALASLQANKATFFFRLERELEKVNIFYLQKEAELKLRLRTLQDKKRSLQSRSATKVSSAYVSLDEGYRLFINDLDKLQQFVEVNQTAFSKILKKWDKTAKSRTKELYLSRAVDVQPCFNRDVISDLSDQATTGLLELQAWAEGEKIAFTSSDDQDQRIPSASGQDDGEVEAQVVHAVSAGNIALAKEWVARAATPQEARERISRVFLATVNTASAATQKALYDTENIDFNYCDSINERNCMHDAAVSGNLDVLQAALSKGANIRMQDVYGRLPLHYACMHGRVELIKTLIAAAPETVDARDLDNFTPLIHGIVHARAGSVEAMLQHRAQVNPTGIAEHIPLNLACQYGSSEVVQHILKYKPQILPDAEGLFPQHIVARFGGSSDILQQLKDYGVNMDQQDKMYQWTPIFHAASEGHLHSVQNLLAFRVSANLADEKGLSAMYYAAWEGHLDCMQLLAQEGASKPLPVRDSMNVDLASSTPAAFSELGPLDGESIPSLSLPPPIIPLRRYGHNFLDVTKTFILLSFDSLDNEPIEFYGDGKYPAARLTISPKSSDFIPRNVPLPVQDDLKDISFQIENLETFSIDFDIYPTFGSKVIARAAASSRIFTDNKASSGTWHLELFDPRLRNIGRLSFRYQVVTPFHGIPLEITHFATYWKATAQNDSHPSNLITGSSLSGDFMRLFVQVTKDGVPVLFSNWSLPTSANDLISRVTYAEFVAAGEKIGQSSANLQNLAIDRSDLASAQKVVARSYSSLADVLALLPHDISVELHICYPSKAEEESASLGPTANINAVVDSIFKVVFTHARMLREQQAQQSRMDSGKLRGFVFSSFNEEVCMALNWKQPNYPVLLCNDLGVSGPLTGSTANGVASSPTNCGRTSTSIKNSVRLASQNNLMGLICSSRLLELVPALVNSVKEAGLVCMADYSRGSGSSAGPPGSISHMLAESQAGIDGGLNSNAVLRFREVIDL